MLTWPGIFALFLRPRGSHWWNWPGPPAVATNLPFLIFFVRRLREALEAKVERLEICDAHSGIKLLRSAKNWRQDCSGLLEEVVNFVRKELGLVVRARGIADATVMTLFERIINREIPAQIIHEDDQCVAIRDINPQGAGARSRNSQKGDSAPRGGGDADATLFGHLLLTAAAIAKREGIAGNGYRIVVNHGRHAGESVPHLHVHLLGGRQMKWPPG